MARAFTAAIVLPGDPSSALHAATKSYVDTADAAKVPTTRQIIAGSGLTGGGALSSDRTVSLARVPNPRVTLTYGSTTSPDASAGNYLYCTLTGATNLDTPSNPTEDQVLRIRFAASSARVVTFSGTYKRSVGVTSTATCPAGGWLDVIMLYDSAAGWTILAASPTQ